MKAVVASVVVAAAASVCCIGPVVAAVLGAGVLGAASTRFEPYRPWFLGAGDPETPYGTSRAGIGGRGRKTLGADQKAVDADGPVDAQNAPTAPWKTADGFPQAPTASIACTDRRRQDTASDRASDNYRVPLRSPAALTFAHPLPAEIVVADRQK